LLGEVAGLAPDEFADADTRLAWLAERTSVRIRPTLAMGSQLPLIDLMRSSIVADRGPPADDRARA
jgi:hypothetical protein